MPAPGSCGTAKERVETKEEGIRCLDWFLCFKPDANAKPHAKRGRKPKNATVVAEAAKVEEPAKTPAKRGRKPKAAAAAPVEEKPVAKTPAKRGRKPKNPVE